jgi:hypothetical protein
VPAIAGKVLGRAIPNRYRAIPFSARAHPRRRAALALRFAISLIWLIAERPEWPARGRAVARRAQLLRPGGGGWRAPPDPVAVDRRRRQPARPPHAGEKLRRDPQPGVPGHLAQGALFRRDRPSHVRQPNSLGECRPGRGCGERTSGIRSRLVAIPTRTGAIPRLPRHGQLLEARLSVRVVHD